MAMTVGGDNVETTPMSDINTTPLVDVMLVLLIIFLITVPAIVQTVKLELPDVRFEPTQTKPENVSLSIRNNPATGDCEVYWGLTPVSNDELEERGVEKLTQELNAAGFQVGQQLPPDFELPEAHIRADVRTPWRCVGGAIYTMQRAGFPKVGFISEPEAGGNIERAF